VSFSELDQSQDISTQLSVINEVIPLTGTFFSGATAFKKSYINITSGSAASGGFFETIYDGSPTSISASALIDLTYGHSSASLLAGYTETYLNAEKQRVYREMAGLLLGNPNSFFSFNSNTKHELFFFSFKRRIFKDEVKKGNTSIELQVSGVVAANDTLTLSDAGAASSYVVGPSGDEAALYSGSTEVGKIYYNAGVVAMMTGVFLSPTTNASVYWSGSTAGRMNLNQTPISATIDNVVDGLRNRVNDIQFQNQTNIHSTIYFCRALNNQFNYSTNQTFVDSDGRIIPTSGTDNQTRTYPTSVALADLQNNILAVAKLSEPVKKSPDSELVFRVRLSY